MSLSPNTEIASAANISQTRWLTWESSLSLSVEERNPVGDKLWIILQRNSSRRIRYLDPSCHQYYLIFCTRTLAEFEIHYFISMWNR